MEINESNVLRIMRCFLWCVLGFLTLFFVLELALSLAWRMEHDTPLLHYVAFLMDKHTFVPYKDVFETSMVGTFLFHLGIGKLFGYSDLAFRIVDVGYLSSLLTISWFIMKPFGKVVALTGPLLFGLYYLELGPSMSLQRDCVGILPIALSLLIARKNIGLNRLNYAATAIGALFALSASIKPHLAIGLPAVLIYMLVNVRTGNGKKQRASFRYSLKFILSAALGFILSLSIPLVWLWQTGGFPYFWEIFSSYIPLHLHLTYDHGTIEGIERWLYLLNSYRKLGGWEVLLIPVSLGTYLIFSINNSNRENKFVILLLTMFLLYSIYPVLSGQFWNYHWMPFVYFGSLCASFILMPIPQEQSSTWNHIIPQLTFFIFLFITIFPTENFARQVAGDLLAPPKEGRVDAIADFLKKNLRPGDTVQPLDWTGGTIHGMLLAEAVVATPFIYDYHFYHHISQPYIQKLRKSFVKELTEAKPRFIIHMLKMPRPYGKDTTNKFLELENFIVNNYFIVLKNNEFTIWETKAVY
jgi:hypothetical protein